jgi:hypothetical protein
MRRIIVVLTILFMSGMWLTVAQASIARGGGGARPAVGNRSAGNINRADVNRGNVNTANVNRGNVNAANVNRGNVNTANVNRNNVNRNNISGNTVNRNVNNTNINRNVNAQGWGNHYWTDDSHWGWGSFAGGAAVGAATGAAVGAAAAGSHPSNVVVAAPPMGTVVTTLPPECTPAGNGQYICGGVTYQPSYEGTNLVYQVVQ